jgi:hypothetical protein
VSAWRHGGRGRAAGTAAAGAAQFATFVLAGVGFAQKPGLARWGGLFQRASLAVGFGWLTAVCVRALRRTDQAPDRSR